MGGTLPKLAVVLLTAIILLGGAATPSLGGEGTDVPAGASAAPGHADLDGNRIFDDLEARLTSAGVDERISVIVLLDHAVTSARLRGFGSAIGGFRESHRFSAVRGFAAQLTKAQVQLLSRLPGVVHVEANGVLSVANDSAQESFGVASARGAAGVDGDVTATPPPIPGTTS